MKSTVVIFDDADHDQANVYGDIHCIERGDVSRFRNQVMRKEVIFVVGMQFPTLCSSLLLSRAVCF